MNRRLAVLAVLIVALLGFTAGAAFYGRVPEERQDMTSAGATTSLVRQHSPVIGRPDASVTIVEFFDPACEACRAFHPVVKQIMAAHPNEVRLVVRYAPFHQGSDEAVRILETARMQGVFVPVLEALLAAQPQWASHDRPQIEKAWSAAAAAGLDLEKAHKAKLEPHITATINQDVADLQALGVNRTPTFFVNGKPLTEFGARQLYDLVKSEMGTGS